MTFDELLSMTQVTPGAVLDAKAHLRMHACYCEAVVARRVL